MKPTIYIDGAEGTTGLRIRERLAARQDIEVAEIAPELRKDPGERAKMFGRADIAFLCLPDAAAREVVALAEGSDVRIIDASTAHRTTEGWAYGIPELSAGHREAVRHGSRVSVPGCYASGIVLSIYPLVKAELLPPDSPVYCHALSGYSGGGKGMIAKYEDGNRPAALDAPRHYALNFTHKHLPEITYVCGLSGPPLFNPIVAPYYAGMTTCVQLNLSSLPGKPSARELWEALAGRYGGEELVKVAPLYEGEAPGDGFMASNAFAGRDDALLTVCANGPLVNILTQFDNLGKGASGAAVQCMNLMLGVGETTGLAYLA